MMEEVEANERKHRTLDLLLLLKNDFEIKNLPKICEELIILAQYGSCQDVLVEHDAHRLVLDIMSRQLNDKQTQQTCCDALYCMMNSNDKLRELIQKSSASGQVVEALEKFSDDADVQAAGLKAISLMASSQAVCDRLMFEENILSGALDAMASFPMIADVQSSGCMALHYLLANDVEEQKEFVNEEKYNVIMTAIENHAHNPSVVQEAFWALNTMAFPDETYDVLLNKCHKQLFGSMARFPKDLGVQMACCSIIETFARTDESQNFLEVNGASRLLLTGIRNHSDDSDLQAVAFNVLERLGTAIDNNSKVAGSTSEVDWIEEAHRALTTHQNHPQVLDAVCRSLTALLIDRPQSIAKSDDEDLNISLDSPILACILLHMEDVTVATSACIALYHVMTCSDYLQHSLMKKGADIAIKSCMQEHRTNTDVLTAACQALLGLCNSNTKHKDQLIQDQSDILDDVFQALRQHSDKPSLVTVAIQLTTCLAEIDFFRNQCLTEGVHEVILESMVCSKIDAYIQSVMLDALAILSTAEGMVDILTESDAYSITVEVMSYHHSNIDIILKGCILLQALLTNEEVKPLGEIEKAATVIIQAMQQFSGVQPSEEGCMQWIEKVAVIRSLQEEGCVVLQFFAEISEDVARMLINLKLHDRLFHMLDKYEDNDALVNLACECLWILSCSYDFKNQILNSACSEGQLKAVELLVQLGADVNVGDDPDLPINNAIQNHNVPLVRFLLKQGVNDLHGCLKRSLSEQDHDITGLLLMHIGLDIEAGIVSWSGLQLSDVHPKWFYSTFYAASELAQQSGTTEVDGGSAIAQRIITTKKKREQRQNRKILLAGIDGNSRSKVRPRGSRLAGSKVSDSPDGERRSSSFGPMSSGEESLIDDVWSTGSHYSYDRHTRRASSISEYSTSTTPSVKSLSRRPSMDSLSISSMSESSFQSIHRSSSNPFLPVNPDDPRLLESYLSRTSPDILHTLGSTSNASTTSTPSRGGAPTSATISPIQRKYDRSLSLKEKRLLFASNSKGPLKEYSVQETTVSQNDTSVDGAGHMMPDIIVESVSLATSTPLPTVRTRRSQSLACVPVTEEHEPIECQIHFLDLSSNGIPCLTPLLRAEQQLLRCFICLQKLDLSNNMLSVFPYQLSPFLSNLKHLDLRGNNLKDLPSHMFASNKLEILDVSHNKINDITRQPDATCFSLRELNISNNYVLVFPAWLCNFVPALHILNVSCNDLKELPHIPLYLPHLRILKLCGNYLSEIPNQFLQHTPRLETLYAANNQLCSLPNDLGSHMTQLTTVKLAKNQLAINEHPYIPRFLLKLPWVRSVDLSDNGLTVLPDPSYWKSQSLRELLFADNAIRKLDLGDSIRSWRMLERLNLRNNKLRQVPKELGQLTSLTTLDLSRNSELSTLPDELGKLNRLWELPLDGLRLDLPPAILKGRTKDIVTFLHQRLKRAVPYNRMKLMLVGYGGRGKTTLIRRLQRLKVSKNTSIATVGVNVREWTITVKHDRKPVDFLLSTWDFAGQEDFYSTHPCFLTGRALYLVVFDLSKGVSEINTIRPWLLTIQALAPSCPVILVGTHKDKVPKDQHEVILSRISQQIQQLCSTRGYPQIQEYVEVSNTADNESIEHLRKLIAKVVERMKIRGKPILGQMIPYSYLKLQKLVAGRAQLQRENKKPPVLLSHQLNQMIKEENVLLDENELPQAVRFLHETGVLLHYEDPSHHLSNLYFIEPEWLCKVMSRVVTVHEINPFINQQGILKKEKLRILLSDYELPGVTLQQYLKLFEKFDIVLPINDNELLIPCKMPVKRPNIVLPVSARKEHIETMMEEVEANERKHRTLDLLLLLKNDFEIKNLPKICEELIILAQYCSCQDVLVEHDAHRLVLDIMSRQLNDKQTQQTCCDALYCMMNSNDKLRELIQKSSASGQVVEALEKFSDDADVQAAGLRAISLMASSQAVCDRLMFEENILSGALDAMASFPMIADVQSSGCMALHYLLANDVEEQKEFVNEEKYNVIMTAIENHAHNPSVVQEAFWALNTMAFPDETYDVLLNKCHKQLFGSMARFPKDLGVQMACCSIIETFARTDESQNFLEVNGASRLLLTGIRNHSDDSDLQAVAFNVLERLGTAIDNNSKVAGSTSEVDWIEEAHRALTTHQNHPQVLDAVCRSLTALLIDRPQSIAKSDDEDLNISLDSPILACILLHMEDVTVATSACIALYHVMTCSDYLQHSLMKKGADIAIKSCMQEHRTNTDVLTAACQALLGLCNSNTKHKDQLIQDQSDILDDVFQALRQHSDKPSLVTVAIQLTTCLAEIDFFRNQCLTEGVHEVILESMVCSKIDAYIQSVMLDALAILSTAEGMVDILTESDAYSITVEVMSYHHSNIDIILKGCILLQALLTNEEVKPLGEIEKAATVIIQAMQQFSGVQPSEEGCMQWIEKVAVIRSLQEEGCVVLQFFAEISEDVARMLINLKLHDRLFHMLDKYEDNDALVNLACECLWILSCSYDFKNQILNSACSEGQLKAVELLVQLGADVNVGDDPDLPINNAIQNHNVPLVRFLLKQGVNDLHGCLKRSLSEQDHDITGLLLMHIGLDIEAGIVSWSGLQLSDVHPKWFYSTFYAASELAQQSGTTEVDGGSAIAQRIITTKKKREQRQNRKILLAGIDGNSRSKVRPRGSRLAGSKVSDSPDGERRSSSFGPMSSGEESLIDDVWSTGSHYSYDRHTRRASSISEYSTSTTPSVKSLSRRPSMDSLSISSMSESSFQSIHRSSSNPFLPVNSDDPRLLESYLSRTSPDILHTLGSTSNASTTSTPSRGGAPTSATISPIQRKYDRSLSLKEKRLLFASNSKGPLKEYSVQETTVSQNDTSVDGAGHMMPDIIVESVSPATSTPLPTVRTRRSQSLACVPVTEEHEPIECQIHFLDLSSNGILCLTPLLRAEQQLLRCFICLQKLDLSNNMLSVFPYQLSPFLSNLKHLDLRGNNLKDLPSHMFASNKLEILDVSHNKINDITRQPDATCFSLRELNISNNYVLVFPAWLCNFVPALHILNVSCNDLKDLPHIPLYLPHLRILKLCGNYLSEIPNQFLQHTPRLETLYAANNQLCSLPNDLSSHMTQLTTVKLAKNQLAINEHPYIPRFLLKLPWVRSVDLSDNGLTVLPDPSYWKSQSLRELLFADNAIRKLDLGDSIRSWRMLERLNLRNNKLRQVPKELGQLTSLTTLDLSRNSELSTLPDELGKLNRLWELPLDGLRLDLPPAILKGRTKDIVTFLHQRLKRAVPYNRMKLMLVGYGGRGKTTLIRRLQRLKVSKNTSIATVGVNVREWTITVKHDRKPVDFLLSTWDFAGQEDFYSTHPCFLTGRALYLVVFDLSKGVSEINTIRPWLLTIQALAPSCPVILVGTHKDKVPKDQHEVILSRISQQIQQLCSTRGYPQIQEYVEVSNTADNESIEHLRKLIAKVVERMKIRGKPILGQMIPYSYLKLQKLVAGRAQLQRENKKPPVLLSHQLNQMIKEENVLLDENELPQAVRFLHETGVLLHYEDPSHHLSNLYFIEPEWLCKVMSRVVTVHEINPFINQQGILKKEKLRILLSDYELPGVTLQQYLKLFEKFDIVLPINDNELLIPCKMPVKRPNIVLPVSARKEHIETMMEEVEANERKHRTLDLLLLLKNDFEIKNLPTICEELIILAQYCSCQDVLVEHDAHRLVLDIMSRQLNDKQTQQTCCDALYCMMNSNDKLRELIQKSSASGQVVEALEKFSDDADVQAAGLRAISLMASSQAVCDRLMFEENILSGALDAMASFPMIADVQSSGCMALHYLLANDVEEQKEFVNEEKYNVIMTAIENHAHNPSVVQEAFWALNTMAFPDETYDVLLNKCHKQLFGSMARFPKDLGVQMACCSIIETFARTDESQNFLEVNGASRLLLTGIRNHSDDSDLQAVAFNVLERLGTAIDNNSKVAGSTSEVDWIEEAHRALTTHQNHPQVLDAVCRSLTALLIDRPQSIAKSDDEDLNISLDSPILACILLHMEDVTVATSACIALYHVMTCSDYLQHSLMKKGADIAIKSCMQEHRTNTDVLTAACQALLGLCNSNTKHKDQLIQDQSDILDDVFQALRQHSDKPSLVTVAIQLTTCLAEIDFFRNQCLTEGVHEVILESMVCSKIDAYIQSVMLDALAILSTAEGMVDILTESDAYSITVEVMSYHHSNIDIILKGCILLQALLTNEEVKPLGEIEKAATVIIQAMQQFSGVQPSEEGCMQWIEKVAVIRSLQEEGCVVLQFFAEISEDVARMLINLKLHDRLFHMLDKYEDNDALVNLACECLWILSCSYDFKNQILNSACSEGQLKAVELLVQLGADVNVGDDPDLPINNAIQNHNVPLVRFLLKQGVNDLHGCLKRSLSEQDHDITGLLLMHIGLDIEAGIVSWSGLQLSDVHPKWFYSTFYAASELAQQSGTTEVDGGSAIAQRIITTKKKREQRQNRKILLAGIDGNSRSKVRPRGSRLAGSKVSDSPDGERRSSSFGPMSSGEESLIDDVWSTGSHYSYDRHTRRASSISEYSTSTTPSVKSLSRRPSMDSLSISSMSESSFQSIHRSSSNPFLPVNPDDPRLLESYLSRTSPDILHTLGSTSNASTTSTPSRGGAPTSATISPIQRKYDRSLSLKEKRLLFASNSKGPLKEYSVQETTVSQNDTSVDGAGHMMPDIIVESVSLATSTPLPTVKTRRSQSLACVPVTEEHEPIECQIHFLDLSSNGILCLTPLLRAEQQLLRCFICLQKLDLSNNMLSVFPYQLSPFLSNLKHLDLRGNNLKDLPSHMFASNKLEILDVSHNKINDITRQPDATCFSLRELNISNNYVLVFPAWLCNFVPALHILNVSCNDLKELPHIPLYLPHLRILKLCGNYLSEIPNQFLQHTPRLETLYAANNQLCLLPNDLGSHMTQLTTVKLAKNQLAINEHPYIPRFLLKLPWVRSVDLSDNGLTVLPDPSYWKSQSLRELLFADNAIRKLDLGDSIRSWRMLERLNLRNNKLRQVPKELGQLTSLTTLDLSRNSELSTLPDELGKLNRLWELPLDGLRLDLPPAILKGRTKDIVTFLHQRLKRAVPYNRMKLMLVGYGGRGKTTLIRRLQRLKVSKNTSIATVGVNVREWTITVKHDRKPVDFLLSTWDFAGQEDFYSTHPCFLTGRALYLVVFDLSKGVSEINTIRPWLLTIQALAPSCPVILVGTHKDKVPKDQHEVILSRISQQIQQLCSTRGYPQIQEYVEVSNTADNESIEHLRKLIAKVVERMKIRGKPILGQMIPYSYLKLQKLVAGRAQLQRENKKPPVLLSHQLNQMIKEENVLLDENELPQAVRFLHETGVLLHYEDPSHHLSNLYFIEPEWLCKVMSRVVTVHEINPFINQQGILKKEKLRILLSDYELPGVTLQQYLKLFEKFDIVLPINDNELLIPCKMPVKRPNIVLPVSARKVLLKRYYDMPYIPIGLWSRLILRILLFAQDKVMQNDEICTLVLKSMNVDDDIPLNNLMKNCKMKTEYWREGIYICWSNNAFILVEPKDKEPDVLAVTVPNTRLGHKLLGLTCDLIDDLVEEWFPGLMEIDPLLGRPLLQKQVPCSCSGHVFDVNDVLELASLDEPVVCITHAMHMDITQLAPDLALTDIEEKFHLDKQQFRFKESSEYLLGDGGFGSVYKGIYKNKQVAVKVFNRIGDMHPHRMLRQEVSVLRHLRHPSLISLEAVGINPRMLIMEFASSGSLSSIWKSGYRTLNRGQQHRIALQVAEGLMFLHQNNIVYRDLKPDNILIFSLNLGMMINAKIADYGISKFTTRYGLKSSEGTPGYRAPEVIRGTGTYNTEVDVYSFGILLYEIVTSGKKPFEDLDFRNELDDAVVKGRKLPPLTESGVEPWPELQDLIDLCLEQIPENRPTSREAYEWLSAAELLCLRNTFPLFKGIAVECSTSRVSSMNNEEVVEVWFAGGDCHMSMICKLNIDQGQENMVQGTACTKGRALCMVSAGKNTMLVGMQNSYICVYEANQETPTLKHTSSHLADSVLSLVWKPSHKYNGQVYAGLANGQLLIFNAEHLITKPDCQPAETIPIGSFNEPIKCMTTTSSKLWLGCGGQPISFELQCLEDETFAELSAATSKSEHLPLITCMCIDQKLWIARRKSSIIEVHEFKRRSTANADAYSGNKQTINMVELMKESRKVDAVVKSMVIHSQVAWVGTSGGHICLIDTLSLKLIKVVKRHSGPVQSLILAQDQGYGKSNYVVSTGMAYTTPLSNANSHYEDEFSFALVWDAEFKNHVKSLTTAADHRSKLIASGQRNWAKIRQAAKLVSRSKTDKS